MQELRKEGIVVTDVFGFLGEIDPNGTRTLLEWFISEIGKDGNGRVVMYDREADTLLLAPDYRERVMRWKPVEGEQDRYHLNEIPDEATFRSYLNYQAFFHIERGLILTQEQFSKNLQPVHLISV